MEKKKSNSEYLLLGEISARNDSSELNLSCDLSKYFLGEVTSTKVATENQWEYVIVFNNPDYLPTNTSISYEKALEIYKNSYINLPSSHESAFAASFQSLISHNDGKIYDGGSHAKKSPNDPACPCQDFLTLLRNTIQFVLENTLNVSTQLVLSEDSKFIYLLIFTDTHSILEEAEITEYDIQMNLSIVDPMSLEPCDSNLRPLRFLNNKFKRISEILKELENFEYFSHDFSEKKYEGEGISDKTWEAYYEYLELIKIGIENGEDYNKLCKKSQIKVNLKYTGQCSLENLWDRLKVKKPIGPYSDFSSVFPERVWKKRRIDSKNTLSILRSTDKIKLLPSYIARHIALHYLKSKKIIADYYPLHNYFLLHGKSPDPLFSIFQEFCSGQISLKKDLISAWQNNFFDTNLPFNKIRKYYGEKIGLYFAFVAFYGKFLAIPSVVGIVVFIMQRLYSMNYSVVILLNAMYSIYMTSIAIAMIENWTRKENCYAIEWGQTDFEEDEVSRPEFTGKLRRSPVSDDLDEIFYPKSKTMVIFGFGMAITVFILLLVLTCVAGILILRIEITNKVTYFGIDFSGYICSIINAVQIQIFNLIFDKIVVYLTKMENQRTQSEYDNSLIIKTYIFQFVNSFNSLYYIAFIKTYWVGCLVTVDNIQKNEIGASCMNELYIQLVTLFVILFLKNIVEIVYPILVYKFRARNLKKIVQTDRENSLEKLQKELDKQNMLPAYDSPENDGNLEDYLELAVMFGYITLFAVAFPLSSFLTYLAVLIEIQVDRYKLLHLFRRPHPLGGKSIGMWWYIFTFNCTAAIFTSVGLVCFTIPAMQYWEFAEKNIYFIYTISVFILIAFQRAMQVCIPDIPTNYRIIFRRHRNIIEKKIIVGANQNKEKIDDFKIPNFQIIANFAEETTSMT